MGMGSGSSNPRIVHYMNIFNNSNVINLYNTIVQEYRKGKNSIQTTNIIETQFQTLDSNISKLVKVLLDLVNAEITKSPEKYLPREILSYSLFDLIQNQIYTNNFSIITEKDIMANFIKVLSKEAAWKAEIDTLQKKRSYSLFNVTDDEIKPIKDITDQQKLKQDDLLIEKASKAKVGNMDVFNKAREIYNEEIKKVENDLNQFLIQKEQDINK